MAWKVKTWLLETVPFLKLNCHMAPFVADVLDFVLFLVGDSPVFEFYVPSFWNTFCQFYLRRSYEQEEKLNSECKI